jgi:hypothetical protein
MSIRVLLSAALLLGFAAAAPAQTPRLVKTYAVADLVVPLREMEKDGVTQKSLEDRLVRLIRETIRPETWSDRGGAGTIDYFPLGMAVVINQTPAVHEEIADLLEQVRRTIDTQVMIELRFLDIADECWKKICEQLPMNTKGNHPRETLLDQEQLRVLLENLHKEKHSQILHSPRLITLNGQTAVCEISGPVCNLRSEIVSVVSSDGKTVHVKLKTAGCMVAVNELLHIPVGKSMVLSGWESTRGISERFGIPGLEEIKGIGEIFSLSIPREIGMHHLVVVTPCIMKQTDKPGTGEEAREQPAEESKPAKCERGSKLRKLLKSYHEACRQGDREQAATLAREALAIDPLCFALHASHRTPQKSNAEQRRIENEWMRFWALDAPLLEHLSLPSAW